MPQTADVSASRLLGAKCLWSYKGRGVLYCSCGEPPPFTIQDYDDSIRIVVSTFNIMCTCEEHEDGFCMQFVPAKLDDAVCHLHQPGIVFPADGRPITLEVVLHGSFNQNNIEVHLLSTRVKVTIAKANEGAIRLPVVQRVSGD